MKHGFWNRKHRLDAMDLRQLWLAYLGHYTIQVYGLLAVASAVATYHYTTAVSPLLISTSFVIVVYPAVWYRLHRFVLHGLRPFSGWHALHHQR